MTLNEELLKVASEEVKDQNRVLDLIRQGANVEYSDSMGRTALYLAVSYDRENTCKTLLENGANANAMAVQGISAPLTLAAFRGNEKIVRLLLENGADPNLKIKKGDTAVDKMLNIKYLDDRIIQITNLLLAYGADVNNVAGRIKPLHWACENNREKVVEFLLNRGVNTDALDNKKKRAVDIAKEKGYTEIVDMIEKKYLSWLRLYHASERGNYDECKTLLEQGALVDSSQFGLYCPVAAASEKGHYTIVRLLLDKRPIVNNEDNNERNPLYLATKNGHEDIDSLLLNKGASPHVKVNGDTLLHEASRNNHSDVVRLLIQKEINPNVKNKDGYTPLHYAAINGNEDIVTRLIENGANVNLVTSKMETPLHLACEGGQERIVGILMENGAKVDVLNERKEKATDILNNKWAETEKKLKIIDNIYKLLKGSNTEIQDALGNAATEPDDSTCTCNKDTSNNEDDDSDSDATVDCTVPVNDPIKPNFASGISNLSDIKELNTKMSRLSALVAELNEKAVKLDLLKMDLSQEASKLNNLNRKIENIRYLKELKDGDSNAQFDLEDDIQELTLEAKESEWRQTRLSQNVNGLQTEISLSKTTVKRLLREIARFIK